MSESSVESPCSCAAILVVHGIGEQNPYESLDAFTRGLASSVGVQPGQLQHRLVRLGKKVETAVHLPLSKVFGRSKVDSIDIFEFYWAGLVQGRITFRQVLGWLVRTGLTPIIAWDKQPALLFREGESAKNRFQVCLRELLRAILLALVAVAILSCFVYAAVKAKDVGQAISELWGAFSTVRHPFAWVGWLFLVIIATRILYGGAKLFFHVKLPQHYLRRSTSFSWGLYSILFSIFLYLCSAPLYVSFQLDIQKLISVIINTISHGPVFAPIIAAAVMIALRRPLVKVIGDIALYVTADEKSAFYRTRAEILEAATEKLRSLLLNNDYKAVYIVGHSLGSVIGYDTINRLTREIRAGGNSQSGITQAHFDKLYGLLTFGSPLDKVYYFFRTEVKDEQSVRGQLLASLHGFRKTATGRDYGSFKFARYRVPCPKDFMWLNVYSQVDLVSGHLDFYMVDKQLQRFYVNPLTAHLKYWSDAKFYDAVASWL